MTALTKNVSRPVRAGEVVERGVAAAAHVRAGAAVQVTGGWIEPATKAGSRAYLGIALEEGDNRTGAAGAVRVRVQTRGAFHFAAVSAAVPGVGTGCFLEDDNTVTSTPGGATRFGFVIDADDDGVWVEIGRGV